MGSDPGSNVLIWQIIIQLFLIFLNAVFACSEIAVISMNDKKLERMSESGNKRAKRLLSLTKHPAKFLATIQIGITFAGFLGSAFAAGNFAGRLSAWIVSTGSTIPYGVINTISIIFITLILSYVTLVLGELVPKRIAMKKAERIALSMSGFVYVISKIFTPLVWLLTVSTNGILRLFRIDPHADENQVTEEEIRIMIDVGNQKGVIDSAEREFVHNVFDFDDVTAKEIMTHRVDVNMLWIEDTDEIWNKTILENFHSVYPICEQSNDNIIGVLYTKRYFRLKDKSRENVMKNAVKLPKYVAETVPADVLLREMKKTRNHFVVVLDEHGGMSGILTLNDLLEQLVGDIDDEQNKEMPLIEKLDNNLWRIKGVAPLDDVAKAIKMPLPCEEFDMFSSMVLSLLATIPDDGSVLDVEGYGLKIHIELIKDHRLETAVISKIVQKKIVCFT